MIDAASMGLISMNFLLDSVRRFITQKQMEMQGFFYFLQVVIQRKRMQSCDVPRYALAAVERGVNMCTTRRMKG